MKNTLALAVLLLAPLASIHAAESQAAAHAGFAPGEIWLDTAGRPINAHGGGMLFHDGAYYWYGENKEGRTLLPESTKAWDGYRVNVTGIRCYSSKDLLNWKDEGLVLKVAPDDPAHDLHPSKVCERPKVVFNPRTKKFVMWMHIDSEDYKAARAGVATADKPTGPFTYIESVRPEGQDSRDQTLFQDDDGKAYRIYSSENNDTTYISLLTDDYLRHSGKFARVFEKRRMEAHVVFKHAGKYWFVASGCTGWDPNPARSAVADSIWGPWTELANPCRGPGAEGTFGGQSTFVFPVAGKANAFIFMADRWNKTNLTDSRYLWLPLQFTGQGFEVTWRDKWLLSTFDSPPNPAKAAPGPKAAAKKGVGHYSKNMNQAVDELGCGWYYNWTPCPSGEGKAICAEFVPMAWNGGNIESTPVGIAYRDVRATGPLSVMASNPRYFTDGNGAVFLSGSHTWNNLVEIVRPPSKPNPAIDFDDFLGFLEARKHNCFRLWAWESAAFFNDKGEILHRVDLLPFQRTGPGDALDGKAKFDLAKFNDAYFDRLRRRTLASRDRGMYVIVMLFNGFAIVEKNKNHGDPWKGHYFNAANNINGVDGDPRHTGKGDEAHGLGIPALAAFQEAYVRKVIDTVNDLDNVLYEITNEDSGSAANTAWQYHMIRFIKKYEAAKPRQHPVGMTVQYPGGSNQALFDSPADWISPNDAGGYQADPPAADGRKVVFNDTDHSFYYVGLQKAGLDAQRAWVWKNFTR